MRSWAAALIADLDAAGIAGAEAGQTVDVLAAGNLGARTAILGTAFAADAGL